MAILLFLKSLWKGFFLSFTMISRVDVRLQGFYVDPQLSNSSVPSISKDVLAQPQMLLTLNVPTTDGKIALFSPFYPWNYGPTMQKKRKKKRPKLCCVWISTCSSYKLLYFLLICSCEIPQKKICGLWLDTPTIRLKAKICNSRLWQQYILSSFSDIDAYD